jgi:hypothetical protein
MRYKNNAKKRARVLVGWLVGKGCVCRDCMHAHLMTCTCTCRSSPPSSAPLALSSAAPSTHVDGFSTVISIYLSGGWGGGGNGRNGRGG